MRDGSKTYRTPFVIRRDRRFTDENVYYIADSDGQKFGVGKYESYTRAFTHATQLGLTIVRGEK